MISKDEARKTAAAISAAHHGYSSPLCPLRQFAETGRGEEDALVELRRLMMPMPVVGQQFLKAAKLNVFLTAEVNQGPVDRPPVPFPHNTCRGDITGRCNQATASSLLPPGHYQYDALAVIYCEDHICKTMPEAISKLENMLHNARRPG